MSAKKIAIVTGANKGIGYEIVKALLESDKQYHIFLGSRSLERGKKAVETLQKECASVNKDIRFVRGKGTLRESFTDSYDVNVAGTHVITWTFMPLLLLSTDPRLIFVSGLGTFDKCAKGDIPFMPQESGWPKKAVIETVGYRCSKTALNMLMLDYHYKLQKDGVKVWCVGPGFLETDLGDARDLITPLKAGHPSIGGQFLRTVVEGKRDADTGKYVVKDGILAF